MNNLKPDQFPPTILENFKHLVLDVIDLFLTVFEEMGRVSSHSKRQHGQPKGADQSR